MPTQVRVPGCTTTPCTFQAGSTILAEIDFTAVLGAFTLIPDVWLIVGGVHIDHPLPPDRHNACLHLSGAACPLAPNQAATHHFQFTITPGTPIAAASIEVSLINHNSDTVTCAVLSVLITP